MMDKLKVGRLDGKKGFFKPVAWDDRSRAAFESLKNALKEGLQVFQLEPDQPFVLRTDASDFAIGAVLEQERMENGYQCRFSVVSLDRVS